MTIKFPHRKVRTARFNGVLYDLDFEPHAGYAGR